jgi:exosortase/archaeosortase family protein
MFSLPIIYFIFTPITIVLSSILLGFFYKVSIIGNTISLNNITYIEIISACIAGSAYLFLLILNLTTPMENKKRFFSIAFSFLALLILNVFRIFLLSILYYNNSIFFGLTHLFFWYFLSTFFVIFIWFLSVKLFSIQKIPIYSDIKYIINRIKTN